MQANPWRQFYVNLALPGSRCQPRKKSGMNMTQSNSRIFVTGDVHAFNDYGKINHFRKLMRDDLTLNDYLIICGDFGIIWDGDDHDLYFKKQVYGGIQGLVLWTSPHRPQHRQISLPVRHHKGNCVTPTAGKSLTYL